MTQALSIDEMADTRNRSLAETVGKEQGRLRNFIRRRVADPGDVEDILQDVFCELVEAYQWAVPVQHVSAWLFRVARNRITDFFRKKRPERLEDQRMVDGGEDDPLTLEDLLPSPGAGPEAGYARSVLLEELEDALEELPPEQREVFMAHEIEGKSFKQLSAESGVSVNTLLSRKHYAVLHLRERLQGIYDEFKEGWESR